MGEVEIMHIISFVMTLRRADFSSTYSLPPHFLTTRWYASTEVLRDLTDESRYNMLVPVAKALGLDPGKCPRYGFELRSQRSPNTRFRLDRYEGWRCSHVGRRSDEYLEQSSLSLLQDRKGKHVVTSVDVLLRDALQISPHSTFDHS